MIHPTLLVMAAAAGLMAVQTARPAPMLPAPALYPANPPTAHTGGFGERSCQTCHREEDADSGVGSVTLATDPDGWIAVEMTHPGMVKAGFQLTARFEDGTQAGAFTADGDAYAVEEKDGIQYAAQTDAGSRVSDGRVGWRIRWTPPATGPVRLHVSAVAGDGDESQFGDWVYLAERTW